MERYLLDMTRPLDKLMVALILCTRAKQGNPQHGWKGFRMLHSWGAIAHWLLVEEESEFSSEMWPLRGYPYCGHCLTPMQIKAALGGFSKLQKKNTWRWEEKRWWRGQGRLGRASGRWIWQTHYRHVWNSQAIKAGEVAWRLRTYTAFADSLSLVPGWRRENNDHLSSAPRNLRASQVSTGTVLMYTYCTLINN